MGLTRFLWSLFDLNGTASRKRGWIIFGLMVLAFGLARASLGTPGFATMLVLFGLMLVIWTVALVQRLHDAGRSGYWALLAQVPGIGLLAVVVILVLTPQPVPPVPHPVARKVGAGVLALLFVLFVSRALYWQPFWIPAESMKPTLLVGDFILVTKTSDLQRGDVLVFRHPVLNIDYVKRLIGLPGDVLQLQGGVITINGQVASQTADGAFEEVYGPQGPNGNLPRCTNAPVAVGAVCTRARLVETLPGGRAYHILNIAPMPADNSHAFTVPDGMLFFMGDNRDNSLDSRFTQSSGGLGFVPVANVMGRARVVVFSSAGTSMGDVASWRTDRYWTGIE